MPRSRIYMVVNVKFVMEMACVDVRTYDALGFCKNQNRGYVAATEFSVCDL